MLQQNNLPLFANFDVITVLMTLFKNQASTKYEFGYILSVSSLTSYTNVSIQIGNFFLKLNIKILTTFGLAIS